MKGARRYLRGRQEIPDLELIGLVAEEHADKVAKWLTEIMEAVGDSVVNGDAHSIFLMPGLLNVEDSRKR